MCALPGTEHTSVVETTPKPWEQAFVFDVPLELRSKSNFRRHQGNAGRGAWKAFKDFEANLALLARQARPLGWELGDAERPLPTRPVVVAFVFARSTLDAANLSKSVLDACEGVVFHNDASVRYCATLGVRTRSDSGGLVAFARLAPDADAHATLRAAWALEALASASIDVVEP